METIKKWRNHIEGNKISQTIIWAIELENLKFDFHWPLNLADYSVLQRPIWALLDGAQYIDDAGRSFVYIFVGVFDCFRS